MAFKPSQPHRLTWPPTPSQWEGVDEMFELLFKRQTDTGVAGATGSAGRNGFSGRDGEDGVDGFGIPGPIGQIGPQGLPGIPGRDGDDGDSFGGPFNVAARSLNGTILAANIVTSSLTTLGTLAGDLLFTDATYDIGKSGATRPRDLFISRNGAMGGTLIVQDFIRAAAAGTVVSSFVDGFDFGGFKAIGYDSSGFQLVLGGYRSSQWNALGLYTSGVEQLHIDTSGNITATADLKYATCSVFSWVSKLSGTVYLAASDGIVTSTLNSTSIIANNNFLQFYSDTSNPPTTLRAQWSSGAVAQTRTSVVTCPVRKGDYWLITLTAGGAGTITATNWWVPLGTSG